MPGADAEIKVHDSKREGDDERYTAHVSLRHELPWGVAEVAMVAHGVTAALAVLRLRHLVTILPDKLKI